MHDIDQNNIPPELLTLRAVSAWYRLQGSVGVNDQLLSYWLCKRERAHLQMRSCDCPNLVLTGGMQKWSGAESGQRSNECFFCLIWLQHVHLVLSKRAPLLIRKVFRSARCYAMLDFVSACGPKTAFTFRPFSARNINRDVLIGWICLGDRQPGTFYTEPRRKTLWSKITGHFLSAQFISR